VDLQTLSIEEILLIHEILVRDFAITRDPIDPPGVKSMALLESAIGRQHTCIGRSMKYPDVISNASTLLFGLIGDHPFHNGNKRTALVSMLVHLDKNKLTLTDTRQDELFNMVIQVAEHTLGMTKSKRFRRKQKLRRRKADTEVNAIISWLKPRVKKVIRGEKVISYFQLNKILERFGYTLKNPRKNTIDIYKKKEDDKKGILSKKKKTEEKKIGNIPFPGATIEVPVRTIKYVREKCKFREEDGVDSEAFYAGQIIIDSFINKYRTLLRRLGKR